MWSLIMTFFSEYIEPTADTVYSFAVHKVPYFAQIKSVCNGFLSYRYVQINK